MLAAADAQAVRVVFAALQIVHAQLAQTQLAAAVAHLRGPRAAQIARLRVHLHHLVRLAQALDLTRVPGQQLLHAVEAQAPRLLQLRETQRLRGARLARLRRLRVQEHALVLAAHVLGAALALHLERHVQELEAEPAQHGLLLGLVGLVAL